LFRNSLAKYVIASSNEWYKGAYGKADGSWSNFPNGTDIAPAAVVSGTEANTAVYLQSASTGPADIFNAGGLSSYGTMGQGGNVWEFMETAFDGSNNTADESRELRGGSWSSNDSFYLLASTRYPVTNPTDFGFRVASVPEPSTGLLVVLGLSGLLLKRRK
jgi:formylglycine-generating enzyme required for sulfatase activity